MRSIFLDGPRGKKKRRFRDETAAQEGNGRSRVDVPCKGRVKSNDFEPNKRLREGTGKGTG